MRFPSSFLGALLGIAPVVFSSGQAGAVPKAGGVAVSYFHDVRPIFQANCQGCHQPAKNKGGYVMTSFQRLLAGGEKDGVAIVPGQPDKGALLEQITPHNGAAEMSVC